MRLIKKKILRKYLILRGKLASSFQKNPLQDFDKHIVTLYHDFEGSYAIPGMTERGLSAASKILEIQEKYHIKTTFCTVAKLAEENPALMKKITSLGHEVASHSYEHKVLTRLGKLEQKQDIQQAKTAFQSLGVESVGLRSPQSSWDYGIMKELLLSGASWSAENGDESQPFVVARQGNKKLWRFPIREDDWQYEESSQTPQQMLKRWKDVVNTGIARNDYTAIGFHPWVESPAERLAVFEEFLAWLSDLDDVVVLPFGEVKQLIENSQSNKNS